MPLEMILAQPAKVPKALTRLAFIILATLHLFIFSGCETRQSPSVIAEQERLRIAQQPKPPSPEAIAARNKLSAEYIAILKAAYPDYNGIHIVSVLLPYDLMASHPLFTGYEFDAGPLAHAVVGWIAENRAEFATAGIARVGIFPDSGGNQRWFNTAAPAQ